VVVIKRVMARGKNKEMEGRKLGKRENIKNITKYIKEQK
jgi:hypothetical protein